jgi:threonine synthase
MLGMWKAFEELESLGLIGADRPRMITVQSEATSPLVHAFDQSLDDTRAVDAGQTMAVGLNVPGGVGHFRVLEIIKRSGGGALAVSEKAMVATMRRYYRDRDWQLCPEGAATLAVLPELRDRDLIRSSDRVVVVNTGSLGKYVSDPREWLAR